MIEWVDIKERLPARNEEVLIAYNGRVVFATFKKSPHSIGWFEYSCDGCGETTYIYVDDVSHWAEAVLPEKKSGSVGSTIEALRAAQARLTKLEADIEAYMGANQRLNNAVANYDKRYAELEEAFAAVVKVSDERLRRIAELEAKVGG